MSVLHGSEISALSSAFEEAPFEFWVLDAGERCIVQNAAARKWGDLRGLLTRQAPLPPEVLAAWHATNRRAYAGELVQNEVEALVGGQRRHYQTVIVPIRVNGHVGSILGFKIDITERRRAEEALRTSEERLKQALRAASAGMWEWDIHTGEIVCSPEHFGFRDLLLEGRQPTLADWLACLHPDDVAPVTAALYATVDGSASEYRAEFRVPNAPGGERWLLAVGQLKRAPDGAPLRITGISIDITDRKRAEENLREVDRRRSDFLGVLSHELRNPLAPIRNSLYLLQRAPPARGTRPRSTSLIGNSVTSPGSSMTSSTSLASARERFTSRTRAWT